MPLAPQHTSQRRPDFVEGGGLLAPAGGSSACGDLPLMFKPTTSWEPGRVKTILVAEDHADVREMLLHLLEQEGYRVVGVADGERAVEAALSERPDLILMDLDMPVMSGIEATRCIRDTPSLADVPILAQSGRGDLGIAFTREFGPGRTFYITKPLHTDELCHLVRQLLRGSERE
jgi:CheY-like chemotaxis protein